MHIHRKLYVAISHTRICWCTYACMLRHVYVCVCVLEFWARHIALRMRTYVHVRAMQTLALIQGNMKCTHDHVHLDRDLTSETLRFRHHVIEAPLLVHHPACSCAPICRGWAAELVAPMYLHCPQNGAKSAHFCWS